MILVVDKTSTSTVHLPNNGKQAEDYVTAGIYQSEIDKLNDKIDNYNRLDELMNKELAQAELDRIKGYIM